MGSLSEEQYKSGSCFQASSVSNLEGSSSIAGLHPGLLLSFVQSCCAQCEYIERL